MSSKATLIKPPKDGPEQSSMENTLELTQLSDIDPNMFTNTRPLWHPPGARGVYGGAVIAQCLAAAQRTVPHNFTVHSMHCYFVLAGNSEIPIIYHVERVRDGRSFATRTVQARQRAKPIFTVTLSFMREVEADEKLVEHEVPPPPVPEPDPNDRDWSRGPFESRAVRAADGHDKLKPHAKRMCMWLRSRGKISDKGGHEAHLSALAYMSDSFFIGTVARAHRLWREYPRSVKNADKKEGVEEGETEFEKDNERPSKQEKDQLKDMKSRLKVLNGGQETNVNNRPEIGMMVSLDHTIYFHRPRGFRADEWLLSEMETPWAGQNRGLVVQRVWQNGRLIATCVQEGLVRLKQSGPASRL